MTAEQTAEQKAAAATAAAEKQAADEKAKQEADAKAAAAAKAKQEADAKAAAAAKTATKPAEGLKVVGAAVVLRADDGSERYLYRGAPVDRAAFSKDSIKHATAIGLIAKAK